MGGVIFIWVFLVGCESFDGFVVECVVELKPGEGLLDRARLEFEGWQNSVWGWEGKLEDDSSVWMGEENREYYKRLLELLRAVRDRAWSHFRSIERHETRVLKKFCFDVVSFKDYCRAKGYMSLDNAEESLN